MPELVSKAQNGDQTALEEVVRNVQDRVHHLSMRILVNPEDAHDATQEILILIITKLSTFKGNSSFHTWVYRVAVNYLLTAKKVLARNQGLSFEMFRADLEAGLAAESVPTAENLVFLNELRISCTMAMLLCLDMNHRVAYVFGDILELDHNEAAEALGITTENYRKRLSRARADVVAFTSQNCGLVTETAKCSCPRRLPAAMAMGRVQPGNITYAIKNAPAYVDTLEQIRKVEGELKTLKLQGAIPHYGSPEDFGALVTKIVDRDLSVSDPEGEES